MGVLSSTRPTPDAGLTHQTHGSMGVYGFRVGHMGLGCQHGLQVCTSDLNFIISSTHGDKSQCVRQAIAANTNI